MALGKGPNGRHHTTAATAYLPCNHLRKWGRIAAQQRLEYRRISVEAIPLVVFEHTQQRVHRIRALPGKRAHSSAHCDPIDRFRTHGAAKLLRQDSSNLHLVKDLGAGQFVNRILMAPVHQHRRRGSGHVLQIDHAQPRRHRIGDPIDPFRHDRPPIRKDVLHVGGRLQDRPLHVLREQQLFDPQLAPMMRHGLDLRMEHRVIDEAPYTRLRHRAPAAPRPSPPRLRACSGRCGRPPPRRDKRRANHRQPA